jgi:hypothetical protein
MPKNPIAEAFGYPVDNLSQEAQDHRRGKLCPFHNSAGINCTKNSATDPLGVCSIFDNQKLAVTCPIRLRENRLAIADAARFFFPNNSPYVVLTEVRLNDVNGKSAGNIDIVLAQIDENQRVVDFGAVEIQAVYITGNISRVFKEYMRDPANNHAMEWPKKNYPKPDYLSSSRKRLAPQLLYKGGILQSWGKKMAVVVHQEFFKHLPQMEASSVEDAEIAWQIYALNEDLQNQRFKLTRAGTQYTRFREALDTIARPRAGNLDAFINYLNGRVANKQTQGLPSDVGTPPDIAPSADFLADENSAK